MGSLALRGEEKLCIKSTEMGFEGPHHGQL